MDQLKNNFNLFAELICVAGPAAWTALAANKILEAQIAIREALRLGTQDAKIFSHAALIARATGDDSAARDYFNRAQKLTPAIFRLIAFQYWKSPAKTEFADAGMRT